MNSSDHSDQTLSHDLKKTPRIINIDGAVKFPGEYELVEGATFKELLVKAEPQPTADLRTIKLDAPIKKRQIHIKFQPKITVILSGATENIGALTVQKGTRYCDLPLLVGLSQDADNNVFTSKRRLRDGELVDIPIKGVITDKNKVISLKKKGKALQKESLSRESKKISKKEKNIAK